MKRVIVAGAGISGLPAAWDLMREGFDVRVIESTDRPGGVIGTSEVSGYRFEDGPASIQGASVSFRQLCEDLGMANRIVTSDPSTADRFLYFRGGLKALPRSFKDFLRTDLFTWRQKLRVLMEPWVRVGNPEREESIAEFFGRRVGRGVTMSWVDVVVSGVYAGNPNRLGIKSAFPALQAMEQEHGSIFKAMRNKAKARRLADGSTAASPLWSLDGGIGVIPQALAKQLGDRVLYSRRVKGIESLPGGGVRVSIQDRSGSMESLDADRVILAVDAKTTGMLLSALAPTVADLLFEIEYSPLCVAQAGFDEEQLPGLPKGFGYLVPRCMRMRTLGWIFASQLFPGRAQEGHVAMNGFIGGTLDPQVAQSSDAVIQHLMMGELALALGQKKMPRPEVFRVLRWTDRIPQYNVGHNRRMTAVKALVAEAAPDVILAGNWLAGISVESCVKRSRAAAGEVVQLSRADAAVGGAS